MQISNGHACAIDRVNKRGTRSRRGSERASSGGRLPGARSWRPETGTIRRDRIARLKEDVKKSRQRKGREDRKEESFEKMLCALCDLCVQRDSFTSSLASHAIESRLVRAETGRKTRGFLGAERT